MTNEEMVKKITKTIWEAVRFQAYITYCSVTNEKDRKSIHDFLPLDNDLKKDEQVGNVDVEIRGTIKGDDLVLALKRVMDSQKRIF